MLCHARHKRRQHVYADDLSVDTIKLLIWIFGKQGLLTAIAYDVFTRADEIGESGIAALSSLALKRQLDVMPRLFHRAQKLLTPESREERGNPIDDPFVVIGNATGKIAEIGTTRNDANAGRLVVHRLRFDIDRNDHAGVSGCHLSLQSQDLHNRLDR